MEWANAIVQGILLGGLYALFAAGLSLIFGVMRLVNVAHGDLIVMAAYLALVVAQSLGVHPLVTLLIVTPVMAVVGYALFTELPVIWTWIGGTVIFASSVYLARTETRSGGRGGGTTTEATPT